MEGSRIAGGKLKDMGVFKLNIKKARKFIAGKRRI
jgi:hypothetical protein